MSSKTVIIGAGLAGLAAGIRLLEKKASLDVIIYNMGHHAGGKAASWRDEKGFNVDHGFHAIFSGYREMKKLLKKAGVKKKGLVSNKGINYFFEEDPPRIHQLNPTPLACYKSYPPDEYLKIARFSAHSGGDTFLNTKKELEKNDEVCYTAYALENGLDPGLAKRRWFRFSQDALFNWPNEISTYITFKGTRLTLLPIYHYVNGNYGENLIAPIVKYFEKLGGKIVMTKKLVRINHDGKRATGIILADPDPDPHIAGKKKWDGAIPAVPGSEEAIEFKNNENLVVTIPVDCFAELNPGDEVFWEDYAGIKNLRTITTLSWQLWTREPVMPVNCQHINGLDEPMPTVVDYKKITDEYKNNPGIGSALEWVGQETGFEKYSDEELKQIIIKAFLRIPGAKNPLEAGIIHDVFNRNSGFHDKYLLTDPGTLKFRPGTKTRFNNVFLAGDWIRSEVDVPTMEGAICTGYFAADLINRK